MGQKVRVTWLEAAIISLMLVLVYQPAFSWSAAGTIPVMHGLFLLGTFTALRHFLATIHRLLGCMLFAVTSCLLMIDLAVHQFTGLHINKFILSLLAQPQALDHIGVSPYLLGLPALWCLFACALSWRLDAEFRIPVRRLAATCTAVLLGSQILYAFLLYGRDPGLIQNERNMPFFIGLHHYYADSLFAPAFGEKPENPFALPFSTQPIAVPTQAAWTVRKPRNVLLVVIDSLRAADIAQTPSLAPNLARWAQKGHLSLNHNSVANCTHFSMHTLFTGTLPTNFSAIRQGDKARGLFAALAGTDYTVTSAEAFPLDWYDLASTYMPGVKRTVLSATSTGQDKLAVDATLATLPGKTPWFHLLYLNGPHFPYDMDPGAAFSIENYRRIITKTDALLGQLLDSLQARGALDDTLVIVTSDHGEEIMENGHIGHGTMLNALQTDVPLLVLGAKTPTTRITSHRDILRFIRAELDAGSSPEKVTEPAIRVGCDYAYPALFAIRAENGKWVEFQYRRGLLSPVPVQEGEAPDNDTVREAGIRLIDVIRGSQD